MNTSIIEPIITVIIYKSYTPAQANAIKKYRQKNKERINGLQRKYYNESKNDEEFLKKKRDASYAYYHKKKLEKLEKLKEISNTF
jgi:TRAP-type mannitol/chloroaromatic compound transport system substrate-binding protein